MISTQEPGAADANAPKAAELITPSSLITGGLSAVGGTATGVKQLDLVIVIVGQVDFSVQADCHTGTGT